MYEQGLGVCVYELICKINSKQLLMGLFRKWCYTSIFLGCSLMANAQRAAWLENAVFYQIYPSTFMDSDGDGIGDIRGMMSKLDYVASLGANALWINPVFVSGWMDGGYDVIDYYRIDPRFGDNETMADFIREAHKRGIKVCLDLVAGHSSNQCEWFRKSAREGKFGQYSGYYIWTDSISEHEKEEIRLRHASGHPERDGRGRFVEANAKSGRYYQKNFFESQPALNYGYAIPDPECPWQQSMDAPGPRAVQQEMLNIMAFWFSLGIDGFRVDMAHSLVKDDFEEQATVKLWTRMSRWVKEHYPDCVLISEWSNAPHAIPAGFDIDFYLPWGNNGYGDLFMRSAKPGPEDNRAGGYFDRGGKGKIAHYVTDMERDMALSRIYGSYLGMPTANHDFARLSNNQRSGVEDLKVAMTFIMMQPGIPFVYYGDELGMRYIDGLPSVEGSNERSGTRTPMQWNCSPTAGFSTAQPEKLYLPVFTENGRITVETEEKDAGSLLNFVKRLIALRKSTPALNAKGNWEYVGDREKPYPMVFKRSRANEEYIVVINPSDGKVEASIPHQGRTAIEVLRTGTAKYVSNQHADRLSLGSVSAAVYKIN